MSSNSEHKIIDHDTCISPKARNRKGVVTGPMVQRMSPEAFARHFHGIAQDYQPRHADLEPTPIMELLNAAIERATETRGVDSPRRRRRWEHEWVVAKWREIGGGDLRCFGFSNAYAFATVILKCAKERDIAPIFILRTLKQRGGRIKNMHAYLLSSRKWLNRENNQASYEGWAEALWKEKVRCK